MKAAAVDFLTKPFDEVLLNAIRQAIERSPAAMLQESEMQTLRTCYCSPTAREREVIRLGHHGRPVGPSNGVTRLNVSGKESSL